MKFIQRSVMMAAVVGLMAAVGASAALAATPKLPAYTGQPAKGNPAVKPPTIIYTGDGSQFFGGAKTGKSSKLQWSVWNGTSAVGTGFQWIDNCNPNCAQGKFSKYPVTLNAYQPKQVSKKFDIFTRLKVTYTGKHPGSKKQFVWKVTFSHGFFSFG